MYDGDRLIAELDDQGAVIATLSWGAAGLFAYGSTQYQFDLQGNVVARTSSIGSVLSTHWYDAHGTEQTTPSSGPFGYKGRYGYYTDRETGLILCTHRYLDPEAGRWLTRDPISYAGGVNLYGYVGNRPASRRDSLGLAESDDGPPLFGGGAEWPTSDGHSLRIDYQPDGRRIEIGIGFPDGGQLAGATGDMGRELGYIDGDGNYIIISQDGGDRFGGQGQITIGGVVITGSVMPDGSAGLKIEHGDQFGEIHRDPTDGWGGSMQLGPVNLQLSGSGGSLSMPLVGPIHLELSTSERESRAMLTVPALSF